jgi:hypothetical protein
MAWLLLPDRVRAVAIAGAMGLAMVAPHAQPRRGNGAIAGRVFAARPAAPLTRTSERAPSARRSGCPG